MLTLSEPTRDLWTPARGLTKAFFASLFTAGCLAALCLLLCEVTHGVWMGSLSVATMFLTTWVLVSIVHSTSGMVGAACTSLVVFMSLLVCAVTDYWLATRYGWFSPQAPKLVASAPLVGVLPVFFALAPQLAAVLGCAWWRHDGGTDFSTLVELASTKRWF